MAKKVKFDGHVFDSKMEYARYLQLKPLVESGEITDFEVHPKFDLIPTQKLSTGETLRPVKYTADFAYVYNNEYVVEDVKGMRTKDYIIKRKLMRYELGLTVREITKNDL